MNEFILKINENPTLRELHNTAFSFSVLEKEEIPKSWILTNFFVLRYDQTLTYNVKFFLKWGCFSRKFVFYYDNMNIIEKLIMYINRGYYIYMELNEYYIPNRPAYKNHNFYHDLLIYGYNKNNQNFSTIAYNKDGLYKSQLISFTNIIEAYCDYKYKYELKIMPFCVSKNYNFEKFDKNTIKKNFKRMLYPSNNRIGNNAYNELLNHIDHMIDKNKKLDLRAFRTISEHAKTLIYLNDFFNIKQEDFDNLLELKKKADYIFFLAIKYNLTLSNSTIKKVKKNTIEYINSQKKLLEKLNEMIFK